ncbi:MAG: acetyl-CoA carboxylase biotin carboxylase subunit [Armatimonadota bacterium]|nr:acetyl-CoA carboxylase biotin carboxylase subunit [Armatimonadota bacterium]MDR5702952.1 acetyl-CoA carboxylase biotin carboxylase subunit [Armatimonadota bacterium]
MSVRLQKVLVANRGEIAVRIIRSCKELGIKTVAVYSDVDRHALHVRLADEAVPLGGANPLESYLNIEAILEAAKRTGAQAIHPGYGFLAENPQASALCEREGIVFIGPPAEVLRICGDKSTARERIMRAGVPVLPGTGAVSDEEALEAASRVGFPLLIKAVSGGGGKGIHLVREKSELPSALRLARGEAKTSFGDERIYLERWLERTRHVEVQIVADHQGRIVHLGERECSIQRRHQKLIEETPSPGLRPSLRAKLHEAAIAAASAIGYINAGTLEFLVSGEEFYFLEVNARLQVEHPITEMVTGLDLVKLQIRVAAGEPLGMNQGDITFRGHALECRISAEDPHRGFFPSLGRILAVREPSGPGIRVDSGIYPGMEVTRHYDPLLAKVVAWAPTREEAILRMRRALEELVIVGVDTTVPFHLWTLNRPEFLRGEYDTRFVEERWARREREGAYETEAVLLAAAAVHLRGRRPLLSISHRPPLRNAWRSQ